VVGGSSSFVDLRSSGVIDMYWHMWCEIQIG
jgi:hypothetical protein